MSASVPMPLKSQAASIAGVSGPWMAVIAASNNGATSGWPARYSKTGWPKALVNPLSPGSEAVFELTHAGEQEPEEPRACAEGALGVGSQGFGEGC